VPVSHTVASDSEVVGQETRRCDRGASATAFAEGHTPWTDGLRQIVRDEPPAASLHSSPSNSCFPVRQDGRDPSKSDGATRRCRETGNLLNPRSRAHERGKTLEKARRNRRRPSSMAEHWFCNFPGGAHTDSRECGRFLEMTGRQARPRHPKLPVSCFAGRGRLALDYKRSLCVIGRAPVARAWACRRARRAPQARYRSRGNCPDRSRRRS